MRLIADQVEVAGRLHPTSLTLEPGAVVAVVGENGAGKSTLLDALAGLLRPSSGAVSLDDTPLSSLTPRARARRIASLGQRPPDSDELLLEERIAQGLAPRRGHALLDEAARALVASIAEQLDLLAHLRTPLYALSGGLQRRAHLARALVDDEAQVLIVDEPHAGVDVAQQALVNRALRRRAQQGSIVAFSVHDLAVALQCADRIVGLRAGSVVLDGAAPSVLTPTAIEALYDVRGARIVVEDDAVGVLLPRHLGKQAVEL